MKSIVFILWVTSVKVSVGQQNGMLLGSWEMHPCHQDLDERVEIWYHFHMMLGVVTEQGTEWPFLRCGGQRSRGALDWECTRPLFYLNHHVFILL